MTKKKGRGEVKVYEHVPIHSPVYSFNKKHLLSVYWMLVIELGGGSS